MKKASFDKLLKSVKQAGRIRRGEMRPDRVFHFNPTNIKKVRLRLRKPQAEFALMIGVTLATLQDGEQGRGIPEGPARALLKIAAEKPEAVIEALSA